MAKIDDDSIILDVNSPFVGEQKMTISLAGEAADAAAELLDEYFTTPVYFAGISVRDSLDL